MREILFKAKSITTGEWVEGSLLQTTAVSLKSFIVTSCCYTFEMWDWKEVVQVDTDTICQYTGLTDKNGNKIWENDLVKRYYADGEEMAISQIVFSEGSLNLGWCKKDLKSLCMYKDSLLETGIKQRGAKECDVIGNIFDNPELLGV